MTRTTGGAGNDEDAGNGDVCVCVRVLVRRHTCACVCVYVYLCARHTCCADGEQAWQHGSAAHMAGTCTTGGDKDEWQ